MKFATLCSRIRISTFKRVLFPSFLALSLLSVIYYINQTSLWTETSKLEWPFEPFPTELDTRESKIENKWIVIDSINISSDRIKQLANISSFKLVVVGDSKTSPNWTHNKTVFLDLDAQNNLKFKSLPSVGFNSCIRKNIGYLYAIKMGAEFIYDTDEENGPIVDLDTSFSFGTREYGLQFDCKSPSIVNPYLFILLMTFFRFFFRCEVLGSQN